MIDFVEDFAGIHGSDGPPRGEIPPSPAPGSVDVALLTHMHSDHADIAALERVLGEGAPVLEILDPWDTLAVGPFEISALPAVDGFGDPQVSWVIAAEGRRVLHAGDTLFHGWWWLAASRRGPFDVAFLPAGGAIVDLAPRQPPSPLPAGMGPAEAAAAAKLLSADLVVPIHYGPLHETPNYVQADDPAGSLEAAARELGISARVLRPGESLSL